MSEQAHSAKLGSVLVGNLTVILSAVITFLLLQAGLFEPGHSDLKQSVAAQLRDPASAQFRNILGEGDTFCGEVNARSALGVYAGYRKFVQHRGAVLFEPRLQPGASISEQADHFAAVAQFARLQRKCHG